jgi:hypothetical protein
MQSDLFRMLRLFAAIFGLMLAFLALEAPAAAHFGAAHVDMPELAAPAHDSGVSGSGAATTAADECGADCGCCTSAMMHAHCHPPAVLSARPDPVPHVAMIRAAWSLSPPSAVSGAGSTPPVPPPNAG